MKFKLNKKISRLGKICILFVSFINIKSTMLNAEESYLNEIEIDSSTKIDTNNSSLPTNPFEIIFMHVANSRITAQYSFYKILMSF